MEQFALLPDSILNQQAAADILRCNERTGRYGLRLAPSDAGGLVKTRNEALLSNGRIEFGGGAVEGLILQFCDSPYLSQDNFAPILHELIEIFYYFKNETLDLIPDEELIALMKTYFDGRCGGSLQLLAGRELERLAEDIRSGAYGGENRDSDGEEPGEDEPV